jgi:hypothetical protein
MLGRCACLRSRSAALACTRDDCHTSVAARLLNVFRLRSLPVEQFDTRIVRSNVIEH